ncbi:MAG TPA: recombinase family protein [Pseudonocardia sp.]|uniref:recombinase family protein n=1 Tax=Pseudonocardia sp. TaxID=60912 RepID=UPI002F412EDD
MNPFAALAKLGTVVAREYLRVSKDSSGRSRSTVEQDRDLSGDAEELGWQVGDSYADPGVGASKFSRKRRGDFESLIADLRSDRYGAQVLMLWEISRGSRQVEEWLELLNLCAKRGVFFWVHTHGRLYDPTNGKDRETVLSEAVKVEAQAWEISQRITRAGKANVTEGRPSGPCPYGYVRIYDPKTRALVSQDEVPAEARNIRNLYARVLLGHTFHAIAKDWEQQGIVTRTGKRFTRAHLRALVLTPTYAGLRGHFPGRKGSNTPKVVTAANLTPAVWPGLVSEDVWWTVHAQLNRPSVKEGGAPRVRDCKHLFSTISRCGVCTGAMSTSRRGERHEYFCREQGHVRIMERDLDEYLTTVLLDKLARPEVLEELRAEDECAGAELVTARGVLAAVREEHRELSRAVGAGELSPMLAKQSEPMILERIAEAEKQVKALHVPTPLRGLIEPGADVADRWAEAPMSTRRELLRALFTPTGFGEVHIMPATRKGGPRIPAEERVTFHRTTPDTPAAA